MYSWTFYFFRQWSGINSLIDMPIFKGSIKDAKLLLQTLCKDYGYYGRIENEEWRVYCSPDGIFYGAKNDKHATADTSYKAETNRYNFFESFK